MSEITVGLMTVEDVDAVHAIEVACFKTPWSRESFMREVTENACARYVVLREDGRAIAYAGVWFVLDEGHITNIAVHPDYRRRGLGDAIVKALLRHAKSAHLDSVSLEVRVSNTAAIVLYKRNGFSEVGRRKGFYQKPAEDAIIMEARLK